VCVCSLNCGFNGALAIECGYFILIKSISQSTISQQYADLRGTFSPDCRYMSIGDGTLNVSQDVWSCTIHVTFLEMLNLCKQTKHYGT